ncbi:hypothetical protein ACFLQR_04695 [Verrucomicrobiota bacterium]
MKKIAAITLLSITAMVLTGCSKKEEKPEPVPEEKSNIIEFDNVAETVVKEEIKMDKKQRLVEEDFNLDGLDDMAVVQVINEEENEVAIYIRKADEVPLAAASPQPVSARRAKKQTPGAEMYYKAGAIRWGSGGKIIGVATRRSKKYTDLLILISGTDGANEMIHYRNDGIRLSRVTD